MFGPSRYWLFLILGYFTIVTTTHAQNPIEEKTTFEAAFQGRCGHGSPCEQLCYELHDGMYECDCKDGYILHKNGYSCAELNSTSPSTSEFEELTNDLESDELSNDNEEDEEDAGEDVLYMRGSSFTIHLVPGLENFTENFTSKEESGNEIPQGTQMRPTSQGPNLEQKLPSTTERVLSTESTCSLECGPGGNCYIEELRNDEEEENLFEGNDFSTSRRKQESLRQRCQCPLGRGGDRCQHETEVRSPRFTGSGWLAFPALRAAYKHVQLDLEFRPEAWDGVLLLAGERDDLQGDFMALILHHGFIEFRFDCGSGVGIVRSSEPVKLNEWNTLSIYRHRWDAWIQLNREKRVQGRSKGLFSRITFREPLFVGGPGDRKSVV